MTLRVTTAGDGQKSALIFPMMIVVFNGLSFLSSLQAVYRGVLLQLKFLILV